MFVDDVANIIGECTDNSCANIVVHNGRRFYKHVISKWDARAKKTVDESNEVAIDDLQQAYVAIANIPTAVIVRQSRRFVRRFFTCWFTKQARLNEHEFEFDEEELRLAAAATINNHESIKITEQNGKRIGHYTFTRWSRKQCQPVVEEFDLLVDDVERAGSIALNPIFAVNVLVRGNIRFIRRYVYLWDEKAQREDLTMVHVMDKANDDSDNETSGKDDVVSTRQGRRYVRRMVLRWNEESGQEHQEVREIYVADTGDLLRRKSNYAGTYTSQVIIRSGRRFVRRVFSRWHHESQTITHEEAEIPLDQLEFAAHAHQSSIVVMVRNERRFIRRVFRRWDVRTRSIVQEIIELDLDDVNSAFDLARQELYSNSNEHVILRNNEPLASLYKRSLRLLLRTLKRLPWHKKAPSKPLAMMAVHSWFANLLVGMPLLMSQYKKKFI
ncbi:hypothetical protein BDF19DRAFT_416907 [Syncephalis fuscata]|nr:hypothetical protein BDF19DRAFT_416907 [Syncephalis fuscata]